MGIAACLSLAASLCTLRLFTNKSLPVAHDMLFHVFQTDQFIRTLDGGAILPRWAMSSAGGYGSPNFIFYAPLTYYVVAVVHFLIPSLVTSLKIVIWISFFLSGVTMFTALERISKWPASLIGAVFYQILPFHLSDLYLRGALAELMAFIWFPLIFMFVHGLFRYNDYKKAGCGLSIALSGIVLTHLVSAFIVTVVLAIYLLFTYMTLRNKRALCRAVIFIAIGLGLSSFYLLPVILERQFVQLDYLFKYTLIGSYKDNFLFLPQTLKSGLINFKVLLNCIVVLEGILFLILLSQLRQRNYLQFKWSQPTFFLYLFPLVLFLTTLLSEPLWSILPGFATLQFPWRWISVMELSLCFLIATTLDSRSNLYGRECIYLLAIFVVSCLIVAKSNRFYQQETLDEVIIPERAEAYTNLPLEYTPATATEVERLLSSEKKGKVSVLSGISNFSVIEWLAERRVVNCNASSPCRFRISTFYYPGWEAKIDGKSTEIGIEKLTGTMLIDVPQGKHTLTLQFTDTHLRRLAKYISLAAFLILSFLCLLSERNPLGKTVQRHVNEIF